MLAIGAVNKSIDEIREMLLPIITSMNYQIDTNEISFLFHCDSEDPEILRMLEITLDYAFKTV